ncbi:hypothetical protein P3T18_004458 [Paraburkholderia sp. GAS199]|uniref:type II toxin-antitoxin system RelB family antitoxin n=1 Tax=Paraburkholderia sp. GAS199 TaxID=3035126 RepID=UPI003D2504FF
MAIPINPIVSEFATAEEAEAYDRWFRAKIARSLADPRPSIPHDEAMARIRSKLNAKIRDRTRPGVPCDSAMPAEADPIIEPGRKFRAD